MLIVSLPSGGCFQYVAAPIWVFHYSGSNYDRCSEMKVVPKKTSTNISTNRSAIRFLATASSFLFMFCYLDWKPCLCAKTVPLLRIGISKHWMLCTKWDVSGELVALSYLAAEEEQRICQTSSTMYGSPKVCESAKSHMCSLVLDEF